MLSYYVAFLRALYQIHQNNHWKCKGTDFYSNHLLFQRLYEETSDNADSAAEKSIGIFKELDTAPELISKIISKYLSNDNLLEMSLEAEKDFLDYSRKLYLELKADDDMTLGLDDLIMSISNSHESHVYLLEQALAD